MCSGYFDLSSVGMMDICHSEILLQSGLAGTTTGLTILLLLSVIHR